MDPNVQNGNHIEMLHEKCYFNHYKIEIFIKTVNIEVHKNELEYSNTRQDKVHKSEN